MQEKMFDVFFFLSFNLCYIVVYTETERAKINKQLNFNPRLALIILWTLLFQLGVSLTSYRKCLSWCSKNGQKKAKKEREKRK